MKPTISPMRVGPPLHSRFLGSRRPMPKGTLRTGLWWALVHDATDLPVVFRTRREALDNRCDEEYLVRVEIRSKK